MIRPLLVLLALFATLYGRSLWWPWLRLDDSLLLVQNEFLGHGARSWWWALTDVEFGRRWMPGFWMLAQIGHGSGAFGFHLLTLVLGAVLVGSVYVLFRSEMREDFAFALTAAFVASPMRLEIFAWSIGFLYCAVAVLCVWAVVAARAGNITVALLCLIGAMACYPQAAGLCLVFVWFWLQRWQGWVLAFVVVAFFALQASLRYRIGYIPLEPEFSRAPWVVPHYVGAILVPLSTMPIVPAGFYWWLVIPCGLLGLAASAAPRAVLILFAIMAPTLLASVTESFWFGARYSTFAAIAVFFFLGKILSRRQDASAPALLGGMVAVLAVMTAMHSGFRSERDAATRANQEARFLYDHPVQFTRPYGS